MTALRPAQPARPAAQEAAISPRGRSFLRAAAVVETMAVAAVAFWQSTFDPMIGVSLSLLGLGLWWFALSPARRHYTPLLWAAFFNLGCVVSFGDLMVNEATYRVHRTPLTGAFAYTDAEMWLAMSVFVVGTIAVVAAVLLGEALTADRGLDASIRWRFRSGHSAAVSIAAWTSASLALTLLMSALGVGRTGMVNLVELPYHLNGLMNLTRGYAVPAFGFLILDMLLRGGRRAQAKVMLAAIFLVGFVGSLTALSRGYLGFLVMTAAIYLVVNRGRFAITLRSLLRYAPWIGGLMLLGVFYVNALRGVGFAGRSVDVAETAAIVRESSVEDLSEYGHLLFSLATSRVGGLQELLGVLSAPQAWDLANPVHIFLEHDEMVIGMQDRIVGFVAVRDGTVATGQAMGLWGSLFTSGSYTILVLGTLSFVLLSIAVEEFFWRRGLPAVALTLAAYYGILLWGFSSLSVLTNLAGIAVIIALSIPAFLKAAGARC